MAVELATAYVSLVPSARGMSAGLKRELGGLDSIADDSGRKAGGGFASGFSGVATAGLLAAGVLAAAALTKGFTDALDQGAAQDKLGAQLGLPEAESKKLGAVAGKLYGEAYGDSLATVNEAIRGTLQQGLLPEDATNAQIESITAKVLDLSTAFDQDLNKTTAAAGTLIKTGLAEDGAEALDILTRGFQQGVDKQGDFLDTLTEYPTLFRNLGLTGKEATGILSQGLRAGARDADKVADALKEFSIRAVDGSKLTAEGFELVGLNAEDMAAKIAKGGPEAKKALGETLKAIRNMKDPVKRTAAAVALFGTQAEDLGDALYAIDPDTAVDALGDVEGAAKSMGDTLNDNVKTKIEAFKRQALQSLATFIAEKVIPAIESISNWAKDNTGTITVIAAAIAGPLVLAFIAWAASAAAAAVSTIAASAPLLLLVGAVALLAAGLVWAYQNIEGFRNAVDAVGRFIRDDFLPALQGIWQTFTEDILPILQVVAAYITNEVVGALRGLWTFIDENVIPVLEEFWAFIDEDVIPVLEDLALKISDTVIPQLERLETTIEEDVIPAVRDFAAWIRRDVLPILAILVMVLRGQLMGALNVVKGAFDALGWAARTTMDILRPIAGAFGGTISFGFRNIGFAIDAVRWAVEALSNALITVLGWAGSVVSTLNNIKIPKLRVPGDTGGNPLIPGPLARGGPANAGGLYLVGEEGPELFVPRTSGVVVPNNKLSAAAYGSAIGSGVTFTGPVILQDEVDVDVLTRKLSFAQMAGAL
jgi:hypothetical protein